MQPKLHVQPQTLDPNRPAGLVERQVVVVLQIEGGEETAEQSGAVIALPNIFRRVIEPAVTAGNGSPRARS